MRQNLILGFEGGHLQEGIVYGYVSSPRYHDDVKSLDSSGCVFLAGESGDFETECGSGRRPWLIRVLPLTTLTRCGTDVVSWLDLR